MMGILDGGVKIYPAYIDTGEVKEHSDLPVDFLCYTPKDLKKISKQITLVRENVKEGIVI